MANFCDLKTVIYELPREQEAGEPTERQERMVQLRTEIRYLQIELAQRQRLLNDKIRELRELMRQGNR
ncbi:MAG: hypothetical protein U0Z53_03055 [Blastocatellia bacterium]